MKKLLVILLSIAFINGMAQDATHFTNVLASNGLNMRSKPATDARIVTRVAYGKQVELLEKTDMELKLGWLKDSWYKVRYRGREGYIYGGYLSELKPPTEQLSAETLSDLLPAYVAQAFTMQGEPTITLEMTERRDTLKHTLIHFENGAELELEHEIDRKSALLILPGSVQQGYVLLEAMLKQSGMQSQLDELRFVTDANGQLVRIGNGQDTISIRAHSNNETSIRLTSFSGFN